MQCSNNKKKSYLEQVFQTSLSEMLERRGRQWCWVLGWETGSAFHWLPSCTTGTRLGWFFLSPRFTRLLSLALDLPESLLFVTVKYISSDTCFLQLQLLYLLKKLQKKRNVIPRLLQFYLVCIVETNIKYTTLYCFCIGSCVKINAWAAQSWYF